MSASQIFSYRHCGDGHVNGVKNKNFAIHRKIKSLMEKFFGDSSDFSESLQFHLP
jgi:hypothetical protein